MGGEVGEVGVGLGLHGGGGLAHVRGGESFDLPCQNVPRQSSMTSLG